MKNINEMNSTELKAVLFDLSETITARQNEFNQIRAFLREVEHKEKEQTNSTEVKEGRAVDND